MAFEIISNFKIVYTIIKTKIKIKINNNIKAFFYIKIIKKRKIKCIL